jgi:hypothetical protein
MSNIPEARIALHGLLSRDDLPEEVVRTLIYAIGLMTRASPVKIAPRKRQDISEEKRREIIRLANETGMTMHQIANKVGIRNMGRISEILTGKR